jgi:hypothetical protein
LVVKCSALTKARNAQEAGAIALVVLNDLRYWLSGGYAMPDGRSVDILVLDMAPHQYASDLSVLTYMTDNPTVAAEVYIVPRR